MGKPVLVLYNKRIGINTPSSIQNKFQKIAFDHDSLSLTIRNINEYVKQNTVRKKTGSATGSKDIVELAAWTVLGLAAVFLANRLAEE